MKLTEYLKGKSSSEFASSIGVTVQAVWQYGKGIREPRPNIARKIVDVTGGKVTMDDLYKKSSK